MADGKWISYLRVSTDKQGKSGLGIEAQRNAVAEYLNGGNWTLVKEFVEVESGKRSDVPSLPRLSRLAGSTVRSWSLPSSIGSPATLTSCSASRRLVWTSFAPTCRTPTS
jgi:hypothetical protein